MAENYKHLYEQMKKMVSMYQDEVVPGLRKCIDDLWKTCQTGSQWVPVAERLPESGVHVLVFCEIRSGGGVYERYVCDGYYAKRYKEQAWNNSGDIACEYLEEDDEYYLLEGWYEVIKNWDDYNSIVIHDFVTHWMPIPEPPKEEIRPIITGRTMEALHRMGEKAHGGE